MNLRKAILGIALVLIGLLLLARTTGLFWFSHDGIFSLLLPFLLIGVGIWLVIRKRQQAYDCCDIHFTVGTDHDRPAETPPGGRTDDPARFAERQASDASTAFVGDAGPTVSQAPHVDPSGKIKYSKLLGDMVVDLNGRCLQNVEMSLGIGDLEIRLAGGELSPGLNRVVISGFIGDVRVFVPPDMPFFACCSNFIGDVELTDRRASGFGNNIDFQTADYASAERKLYIAAHNFIGDIKVHKV
ncbi:MAG: cell wall-active antibiotics response protein LiaF [candidate division Zixibacteria bacterium]|nr:cell wall-active antibiotics response protein LiaF [candidate division Zixibacteria bacterium]MDH3936107.1 cell wall-active antibiotics response protein LiaF [candidate division Zixibacteria bacterium]MDH4032464.1 cell wall-active antibiotics response protein LiaF [candidate division Zixibacteria bacterium]